MIELDHATPPAAEGHEPPRATLVRAWVAVLGGPAAWVAHLLVGYFLAALSCFSTWGDTTAALYVLTAITGLGALASLGAGLSALPRGTSGGDATEESATAFLGLSGVLLSGLSLFAIAAQSFAFPVLEACS